MSKTSELVKELTNTFSKLETISGDAADKLGNLLEEAPEEDLVMLVRNRVNFCAPLASIRLKRKYGWTSEAVASLSK